MQITISTHKISRFFILLIILLNTLSSTALDQHDTQHVQRFISLIKQRNIKALSQWVRYPLERDYPIPPIKTPADMISRFDEVFDQVLINQIIQSDPNRDWDHYRDQGIMLDPGIVWLSDDGKLIAVNHQSKSEAQKKTQLIQMQKQHLHPSLRQFNDPILDWETSTHRVRIDLITDERYRLAVWSVQDAPDAEPTLILNNGFFVADGSDGNHHYDFQQGPLTYRVEVIVLSESDQCGPGNYIILRDDQETLTERAKPE